MSASVGNQKIEFMDIQITVLVQYNYPGELSIIAYIVPAYPQFDERILHNISLQHRDCYLMFQLPTTLYVLST